MTRRTLAPIIALFVIAAMSCSGSTAEKTAGDATDADGDTATSRTADGDKNAPGGNEGRSTGSASGPGDTSAAGPGAAPGADVGAATGSTAPIRVAFILQDTAGTSAYTGGDFGGEVDTQKRETQALVDWANANGGVNGRKIVPRFYRVKLTASDDDALATCTKITEDDHNQVVIDANSLHLEKDSSCYSKHKVNLLAQVNGAGTGFLKSNAPYIATTATSLDRQMKEMASALKAIGYFKDGRIGISADDLPAMRRSIKEVLVPALASVGVKPVEIRYASVWDGSAQQQSQAQAQMQSAVLSFKSQNINRVITFNYGLNFLGFSKGAKAQGYDPRYAFPEYLNAPGVATTFADEDQINDAVAVSSSLGDVVNDATEPATPKEARAEATPGDRRCRDIMSKQLKTDYYSANSGASTFEGLFCDHFLLWLDSARKLGTSWVPAKLGAGLKLMGTSYQSPRVYSTNFGDGRMDGASSFAVGKYNAACNCFVRTGSWRTAPT